VVIILLSYHYPFLALHICSVLSRMHGVLVSVNIRAVEALIF